MKQIMLFLSIIIFFSNKILAEEFFVSSEDNKTINIFNKDGELISDDLKKIISSLENGDKLFFKRGERFDAFIDLTNKENISLSAYGDNNLSLPIIDHIIKIPFDDKNESSLIYPSFGDEPWNDESWNNLLNAFNYYLSPLASFTKNKIATEYEEVKDKIHQILRIKLPYLDPAFDPHAIRLWIGEKEILRALYFEELNCTDCEYKIKYFYESKTRFLYLFSNDFTVDLNSLISELRINNANYFTIRIRNSKSVKIENLDIRGGKYAVLIRASKDINISDSSIGKGSFTGIYVTNDNLDFSKGSENIIIDNCTIDSDFKLNYRFYSERGVQDGIFFLNNVSNSVIRNSSIKNWGHTGINLTTELNAPSSTDSENLQIINNEIYKNTLDGKEISYMRAFSLDGSRCRNNRVYQNVIKNMTVRSQINGINNIIKHNLFYNTRNSQIKKDQGYGSGEALQLEAYGKSNESSYNIIERNLILKSDEAGISLSSNEYSGYKKDNLIKDNILIDCGNRMFIPFEGYKKDYNQTAIDLFDYTNSYESMKGNDFIGNKIYTPYQNSFVFYKGELLTVKEFNLKNDPEENITIKDNVQFPNINLLKTSEDYDAENFPVTDKLLFIYRYYLNIFKRIPDKTGLFYWIESARSADSNSTETNGTKTAFEIAQYFFTSKEIREQNLSDEEFIKRIYYTMLNREPDKEGFEYWKNRLKNEGIKREAVFYEVTFVTDEFKKSSEEYSLVAYDQKDKLSSFIQRIYIYTLDRLADPSGLNYWLNSLLSGEKSASDIVKNFFHSEEFLSKNLSDEEFVITVYRAVMGRDGDEGGINFWSEKLKEGLSRDELIEKFLNSEEFKNLAETYGIKNI